MKFLFDLFPIILFFVAFKLGGIYVATGVAIAATLLQVAWSAFRHRKVDAMLWVSLAIIVVFGGATIVFHDDTFVKIKPTALYWAFTVGLLVSHLGFGKNMMEVMMSKQLELPHRVWGQVNLAWAGFFAFLGALNLFVAFVLHVSLSVWVNFKLFGCLGLTVVFVVGQSLWLAKYMKEE